MTFRGSLLVLALALAAVPAGAAAAGAGPPATPESPTIRAVDGPLKLRPSGNAAVATVRCPAAAVGRCALAQAFASLKLDGRPRLVMVRAPIWIGPGHRARVSVSLPVGFLGRPAAPRRATLSVTLRASGPDGSSVALSLRRALVP